MFLSCFHSLELLILTNNINIKSNIIIIMQYIKLSIEVNGNSMKQNIETINETLNLLNNLRLKAHYLGLLITH